MKGIAFALDAFTKRAISDYTAPVYHPFRIVSQSMGREVVTNPLVLGVTDIDGL